MSLKRCKFCSMDFHFPKRNEEATHIPIIEKHSHHLDQSFCESCEDLDLFLKPDKLYGQVLDVKKVEEILENSHLNPAQQKVYLKYGLIHPKLAVEKIKLDNTWQDSDYPTLTLEDLNYRHLSLFQQIPTGFYLVPLIILGSMILNDSWLVKFLGIIGMGGIFYLLYRIDQNTQFRAEKWMPPRECEFIDLKK